MLVGLFVAGAIILVGLIVGGAIFVRLDTSAGAKGRLPTETTTEDFRRQMLILTALENGQASALKDLDFRYGLDSYLPRKGEVALWAFPNTKFYHLGIHSEWQAGSAGVSFV